MQEHALLASTPQICQVEFMRCGRNNFCSWHVYTGSQKKAMGNYYSKRHVLLWSHRWHGWCSAKVLRAISLRWSAFVFKVQGVSFRVEFIHGVCCRRLYVERRSSVWRVCAQRPYRLWHWKSDPSRVVQIPIQSRPTLNVNGWWRRWRVICSLRQFAHGAKELVGKRFRNAEVMRAWVVIRFIMLSHLKLQIPLIFINDPLLRIAAFWHCSYRKTILFWVSWGASLGSVNMFPIVLIMLLATYGESSSIPLSASRDHTHMIACFMFGRRPDVKGHLGKLLPRSVTIDSYLLGGLYGDIIGHADVQVIMIWTCLQNYCIQRAAMWNSSLLSFMRSWNCKNGFCEIAIVWVCFSWPTQRRGCFTWLRWKISLLWPFVADVACRVLVSECWDMHTRQESVLHEVEVISPSLVGRLGGSECSQSRHMCI